MKLILLILFSILISIVISAPSTTTTTTRGISNVFSKNDLINIKKIVESKYDTTNKLYGNVEDLKDTFYSVGVLTRIGETVSTSDSICKSVVEKLKSNKYQDFELVFNGITILSELKCVDSVGSALESTKIQELVKSKLTSGSLLEMTQAVNIYFNGGKQLSNSAIDALLQPTVQRIVSLIDEDGTFKSVSSDDEGTIQNTGVAYFALARLAHRLKNVEVDKQVAKVVSKLESVFASADETSDALFFNDLATTASLLHGSLSLASVNDKVGDMIGVKQINQVAEYLLKHKNVDSLSEAYYLLVGLKKCQKNSVAQPISVSLVKSIFSPSGLDKVQVRVTDIFTQDIDSTVVINKVVPSKSPRSSPIITGKQMTAITTSADQGKIYNADLSNENLKLGSYNFEFKVTPLASDDYNEITNIQMLTITGSVTVNDMKISYAPKQDQLGSPKNTQEVVFGQKLPLIEIPSNNIGRIFFRLSSEGHPYSAQQVGIRFYSPSKEVVVPAVYSSDSYTYTFSNKDLCALVGCQSANYQLDLIVGDQSITPFQWNFGEVNLKFNQSTNTLATRYPEKTPIVHQFRVAEKRPPQSVSSLFTLLVLSPAAIFILGLLFIRPNLSNFPTGLNFIYTMGFIGCISSAGLLIANYWFHSTMDVTLKNLALLSIPTIFLGHKSMSCYSNKN